MDRQPVQSSNLESIGYDESSETLEISFLNGTVYQYFNVPIDVYTNLMNASSHGSFLAHDIKGVYTYQRVS